MAMAHAAAAVGGLALALLALAAIAEVEAAPDATEASEAEVETWRGLTVAPERRCAPFARRDYRYPQSVELRIIEAMGGRIYGPYTGTHYPTRRHTDIEHIVAVSEAHDSGLCARPAERQAFARDLRNLTLASPSVNRHRKRAKDAAEWMPKLNRCWFAARVVEVRRAYGLTIDRREADALDRVLAACRCAGETTEMVVVEPSETAT